MIRSQSLIHHCPAKLAANTPVAKMIAKTIKIPTPGKSLNDCRAGFRADGNIAIRALITEPKTPSNTDSPQVITQIVMAKGAQTSMPAIKYFFMKLEIIGLS